jgi:hypothetical protein
MDTSTIGPALSGSWARQAAAADGDAAFVADRLLRVDQHIDDDLLDQILVDPDRRQVGAEFKLDLDVAQIRRALDETRGLLEEPVEIDELLLRRLLARKIEQPADDRGASARLPDHQVDILRVLAAVGNFLSQQGGKGQHASQGIVEFMRDSGCEHAHGGEFLAPRRFDFSNVQFLGALRDLLLQGAPPFLQFLLGIPEGDRHGIE